MPELTVVIPTRNESANVGHLLERLACELGSDAEVLFVDDSDDGTPDAVRAASKDLPTAVRMLHRPRGDRSGGLGGAVIAGLRAARADWVVVMDGDLQHPPELAKRLVDIGKTRNVDLVVASRSIAEGGSAGLTTPSRKAVSATATAVAKTLFPRKLARCSDPLSGFFAVRREMIDPERLHPVGFKILLEILVRTPSLRIAEVPFLFAARHAGHSKASPREGLMFTAHLARLRALIFSRQVRTSSMQDRSGWLMRALAFGLVGLSGVVVNMGVLWLATRGGGHVHYLLGAALATEASTTWLFVLSETVVFRGRKPGTVVSRGIRFYLLNHIVLLLRLPIIAVAVGHFGVDVLVANFGTLVIMFAVRFLIADSAIYGNGSPPQDLTAADAILKEPMRLVVEVNQRDRRDRADRTASGTAAAERGRRRRTDHLPYRYAISDLVTVGSQVPLPELEYFRAQWLGNDTDIRIRVGTVGSAGPQTRATMTQLATPPGVRYTEHFGALGGNFRIKLGEPTEVLVAPLLARSPHVLYTNVIEALLRFVAVSRGAMLLHSACLELNGTGLLLSARTDTGKTGTVLRLTREFGAKFLSDDMTILYPDGRAVSFPKPLTISHHTLRAVHAGDLTKSEWRRLKIQSRLHSKEGRQFALVLSQLNIPIMWLNSVTQRLVPPPKYTVDRLVPCEIIRETQISELFIIERGPASIGDVEHGDALDTLLVNTDDAYGFPPFRQFAPSIVIGDDDYLALRGKERAILSTALTSIRSRQVSTDDFTWADRIPELLGATRPDAGRSSVIPAARSTRGPVPPGVVTPPGATAGMA